ncbi:MAG: GyrI-like domain-containing protein [Chloroflexi bacterium]|nr:GyrI-like domain-containing protein [Chloroflexota bacterium]
MSTVQRKKGPGATPQIAEMPSQKMAVVYTKGDPARVAPQALRALYASVYALKFALRKRGVDFKVAAPRTRWPNAHLVPNEEWVGVWGLPVPDDTAEPPQRAQGVAVRLEAWEYGTVAQVLHVGPYSDEMPTVERLHRFIAEQGYQIAGAHEEEYLTSPRAKVQKTIIRYPVCRK